MKDELEEIENIKSFLFRLTPLDGVNFPGFDLEEEVKQSYTPEQELYVNGFQDALSAIQVFIKGLGRVQ